LAASVARWRNGGVAGAPSRALLSATRQQYAREGARCSGLHLIHGASVRTDKAAVTTRRTRRLPHAFAPVCGGPRRLQAASADGRIAGCQQPTRWHPRHLQTHRRRHGALLGAPISQGATTAVGRTSTSPRQHSTGVLPWPRRRARARAHQTCLFLRTASTDALHPSPQSSSHCPRPPVACAHEGTVRVSTHVATAVTRRPTPTRSCNALPMDVAYTALH
jgi:hypothetical protein